MDVAGIGESITAANAAAAVWTNAATRAMGEPVAAVGAVEMAVRPHRARPVLVVPVVVGAMVGLRAMGVMAPRVM